MEPKIPPLTDWLQGRNETVTKLLELTEELNKKYKNCSRINALGAGAGVTGVIGAAAAGMHHVVRCHF